MTNLTEMRPFDAFHKAHPADSNRNCANPPQSLNEPKRNLVCVAAPHDTKETQMEMRAQTKKQAMVAVICLTVLAGIAMANPRTPASQETQSFIGTTPNATTIEALPPQF